MIRIDREGLWLAFVLLAVSIVLRITGVVTGQVAYDCAAGLTLAAMAFTLYFFRDPERTGPIDTNAVVSAADGMVVDISRASGEEGFLRIAVFMNVFNVHINRSPVAGTVLRTAHRPGRKLNARSARAADENEYGEIDIESTYGLVRVRQIAGLVARRVVTRVKPDEVIDRGGRIGLIRFGSRVDVYLPETFTAVVSEGERVRAGETVIAKA